MCRAAAALNVTASRMRHDACCLLPLTSRLSLDCHLIDTTIKTLPLPTLADAAQLALFLVR